jgi:hypothetical protein
MDRKLMHDPVGRRAQIDAPEQVLRGGGLLDKFGRFVLGLAQILHDLRTKILIDFRTNRTSYTDSLFPPGLSLTGAALRRNREWRTCGARGHGVRSGLSQRASSKYLLSKRRNLPVKKHLIPSARLVVLSSSLGVSDTGVWGKDDVES